MKREKLTELRAWKTKKKRKPLIIKGARQVGKTWLMKSFGESDYKHCAYINFEKKQSLKPLFQPDINIDNIISAIQIETGVPILPNETLIILDEIQAIPEALTALKYFNEDAPQYHIIAAGSLLGVSLHSGISFPVGNVEFSDLMPLNYIEFLDAMGDESLSILLRSQNWELIHVYKDRFINRLRQYYYLGGMPEVVADFRKNENPESARTIQNDILKTYELDFSKYPPAQVVPRIRMLWNAVPAQLAKENKKLIFSALKEGGRAKDFEFALSWLEDSGLIHKARRVSKPAIPLKSYEDMNAFKLFINDVGLLSAMNDVLYQTMMYDNSVFSEFKGSLTEQYVIQQLLSSGIPNAYYWSSDKGKAEIDFVVQHDNKIIPLEVKAEENLKSKSLPVYIQKFNPSVSTRVSMSDYCIRNQIINIPLYALNFFDDIIRTAAEQTK